MTSPADATAQSVFRLGYVPGATPAKWARVWAQRHPDVRLELVGVDVAASAAAIAGAELDMVITRLPDALSHTDPGPHHTITLYEETTVIVVPKDHVLTLADEVTPADLDGENLLWPQDQPLVVADRPGIAVEHRPGTTADAVELVAAGIGLLLVPQSLARMHHRRDLEYRPMTGVATSTVGLLWAQPTTGLADEFIGVVRGRKPNSSRGAAEPTPKRSAKEKAAAKRASREAAGKVPGRGKSTGKRHQSRRPR